MSTTQKSTTLYSSPFSKAYWHDAAAEMKSTKTLVIAALMIALRVATKGLAVPFPPNLKLFSVASFINALGAMIFGPVVAIPAAFLSDFLGVLIWEGLGTYFLPYALMEIGSSLIWALLLYRAKVTPWRVMMGRLLICVVVNVLMGVSIDMIYQKYYFGVSTVLITLFPRVLKNMFMFPVEAIAMTFFLRLMIPITDRMGLTYGTNSKEALRFNKKYAIWLVSLFLVGALCEVGYLFNYYNTTSLSASYSASERYDANCRMTELTQDLQEDYQDDVLVTTVESAYRPFLSGKTTYNIAVYVVDESALAGYDKDLETIRGMSKSKAKAVAEDGVMELSTYASITVNDKTGEIVDSHFGD